VPPSGSTGVMIFWGRSQLRVFAPSWQIKVLPSRQGESCRFMPQNEFCGYENSAFQAENILKNDVSLSSTIRLTFAWKAITFITAGHDLRTKTFLPLLPERQNYCSCTDKYPCRRKANIRLPVFAPSWRINVLPSGQVSDEDWCCRLNAAVMKIRLFKPGNILEYRNIHRSGSLQFTGSLLPERQ